MAMKMKYYTVIFLLLFITNTFAQISGCTDPLSTNYNPAATINDGSCAYATASVAPAASVALPATVVETSALITWNGNLYTNNDNTETKLHALNPATGAVVQSLTIPGVTNIDWEEISQDDSYIYIGDFGNNNGGNRTNLKIYKVEKASLLAGSPVINIISFSYPEQTSLASTGGNNTDFDCEAFIVSNEKIYLFTKQWVSKKTSVYSLPKTEGTYAATLESTYNVNGLITGVTYLEDKRLVVLTGYSNTVQPFLYLLYDFEGNNFFGGNKRKINVSLAFNQTEGITTTNGLDYYVTNEKLVQSFLTIPQKLHRFNLRPYLSQYVPEPTVWNGTAWTNGIPDIDADVVIEGDYDSAQNGEITAATLTINSGNVTIAQGHDFTIKGAVNIAQAAAFTIENNANLIQTDNVQNTGIAFVEKNSNPLQYLDYTLWSSPVSGTQTLKEFSPQTLDKRFYVYNTEQNCYDNYESASGIFGGNPSEVTFTKAKGYLIRMPYGLPETGTTIFEGTFNGTPNNGDITIPLVTAGSRFNAVGNPYPSPISIYDFIDENQENLENGTLYFWRKTNNPNATSYTTINKLAYIANSAAGGEMSNGNFGGNALTWVINAGQGFFVRASATAGNLVFKNSMRRGTNNGQLFRNGSEVSRIWLNIGNTEGAFSQTAIGYTPEGTTGLDYGYDGLLFNDEQTSLYTMTEGKKLAIQARPEFTAEDIVPLAYKAATAGSYTISLNNADGVFAQGQEVFLKDNVLNTVHNLSETAYTFTIDAGNTEERFEVVFSNSSLGVDENTAAADGIIVYRQDNTFFIDANETIIKEVAVFDISGRRIYNKTGIDAANTTVTGLQAHNQILIIQITIEDNSVVSKKVIN
jgi:hypothetical protein